MNMDKTILKKKIKTTKSEKKSSIRQMDLMVLPGFLLVLVFSYIPMFGTIIAFKNFNPNLGIFGSKWVGFDNFKFLFQSSDFVMLIRNTLLYGLWFIVLCNFTNIIFAILCYNVRNKFALKFYQTTSILPTFMSIVLVSYIVYIILSPTSGVLNNILEMFGLSPIDWYAEPKYWPFILSIVKVWNGVGYGSLLYYATMVGIDQSLFEAAEMDGANKLQQTIYIIIPEVSGLLCLQIIMGVGHAMSGDFGLFYQIPRNIGVLYPATDILNTYTFRALQTGTSMGRTTAIGLFQSVTGTVMLLICNMIIRKIDKDKAMF